jgi:hypothetical protein
MSRIFPTLNRSASAIAIHSTAVFPKPVGITMSVEAASVFRKTIIWYALACTPYLRKGCTTTAMAVVFGRGFKRIVWGAFVKVKGKEI